ncbi:DMT family transporter [Priestia endophytica]|uniref:DMT family transporter n=1 Tax=Priestia endophytica TaxID=135735 RepID=UPI00227FF1C3|nr:multidrug efflux SMR transporter [Priestia endophytica]MCY8235243.1 multidrug efflux SMR transporter [Priestia endophytica]
MKGYIFLALSIVCEVFGTSMLKLSNGFTFLLPSFGVIVGFALAFYFLSLSLKYISLSLGYGIWAGAGTALTTLVGIIFFKDAVNSSTFISLAVIIIGVVLLNSSSSGKEEEKPSSA